MKLKQLPKQNERMESGPVQFGDDWPGMFLRGDCALPHGFNLETICNFLADKNVLPPFELKKMRNLAALLQECHAKNFYGQSNLGAQQEPANSR